jgi:hypothetical protein
MPEGLPLELTPLAFLVGKWEGTGVISYKNEGAEEATDHEFAQQVEFAHDGQNALTYISSVKLTDASGVTTTLPSELGYWRVARAATDADHGPGLLPGVGEPHIKSHEELETLRTDNGYPIQVSTLHPGGVAELYNGFVKNARIDLASAHGVAFEGAKTYRHSTRMYGLVENALLWVWDIALPGADLKSHASARLERVE